MKRRNVLKKILANMTMGNDMSALFLQVVQCMNIPVLEIKKSQSVCRTDPSFAEHPTQSSVAYLYLINYAKAKPDEIHHAIPFFEAVRP